MHWIIHSLVCTLPMLSTCAAIAHAGDGIDETFGPDGERAWTREAGSDLAALAYSSERASSGLAFDPTLGFGSIWRRVDLGAGACEVSCEVELTRGSAQPWRRPGLVVALCSVEPAKMMDDDWALILSIHKQGLRITAVRQGVLQPKQRDWNRAWYFYEQEIPKRYEVTQGGAGGHHHCLRWPEKNLAGQRLRLWAARVTVRVDETVLKFAPESAGLWQLF